TKIDTKHVSSNKEAHLDYSDCTVSRPFTDYHLHLFHTSQRDRSLHLLWSHGVGTCYEGGQREGFHKPILVKKKKRIGVVRAGKAIYKKGGYGKLLGIGVESEKDIRLQLKTLCSSGIEYLKVINSGVYDPRNNRITKGGFTPKELRLIVSLARQRGLRVFAHANGKDNIMNAVHAGVDAIVHGFGTDIEVLEEMVKKRVSLIPTLHALQALDGVYKSEQERKNLQKFYERHFETVSLAIKNGVKILPGSDSGPGFLPHGSSFIKELKCLEEAGMKKEEILFAATGSPPQIGEPADLIFLNGLEVVHRVTFKP
ncbi:MAG: hypothetical protein D6726_00595, partial [Nitrospirae bacterium]